MKRKLSSVRKNIVGKDTAQKQLKLLHKKRGVLIFLKFI